MCRHSMLRHVVLRTSTDLVRETVVDGRGREVTRVKTTPRGVPVTRTVSQIEREVPVCVGCLVELEHGLTIEDIRERFRSQPAQVVQSNCPAGAPSSPEENRDSPPATRHMGGLTGGSAQLRRIADMFDDDRR